MHNISLKQLESGTGGVASGLKTCPKNGAKTKVEFKALTEWCELEVKNINPTEVVELTKNTGLSAEKPGCEFAGAPKLCIEIVGAANVPLCGVGTKLAIGGSCFTKVEYKKKPAAPPEELKYLFEAKSKAGETFIEEKLIAN